MRGSVRRGASRRPSVHPVAASDPGGLTALPARPDLLPDRAAWRFPRSLLQTERSLRYQGLGSRRFRSAAGFLLALRSNSALRASRYAR